jgi:hypothetical protein
MTDPTYFRHQRVTEENVLRWVQEFSGSSMWLAVTDFDAYSFQVKDVLDKLQDKKLIYSRYEHGLIVYYPAMEGGLQ